MKGIFITMLMLLAFQAHALMAPIGRSTNLEADGSIKSGTLEQHFINVINRNGSSTAAGTVMCASLTEDDGASAVSCPAAAGGIPLCVLAVACADDAACKCQTYGLHSSVLFDAGGGQATAGQGAYVSESNAGYVQATVLGSVVATDRLIGAYYDSPSVSGATEIFLLLGP